MRKLLSLFAAIWLGLMAQSAFSGEAAPVGDPAVEARLLKITEELRCLTCMGQSIADSHSGFSEDMRREIREMITQGKTDKQIIDFMVQRYGDFVLYRPPVKSSTWLLWFGPFLLFVAALAALIVKLRKRSRNEVRPLTEEEHAQAARLLQESEGKSS